MSKIKERKAREYSVRERQLLNIAESFLGQGGNPSWTMDGLIKNSEYSRGTIYKHFRSKEDVVAALYIEKCRNLKSICDSLWGLNLCAFEALRGLHCIYHLFCRDHVPARLGFPVPEYYSTFEGVSEQRREHLISILSDHHEQRLAIVGKAIRDGEVKTTSEHSGVHIELASSSLCFGVISLVQNGYHKIVPNLLNQHIQMITQLVAGYGWVLPNCISNEQLVDLVKPIIVGGLDA